MNAALLGGWTVLTAVLCRQLAALWSTARRSSARTRSTADPVDDTRPADRARRFPWPVGPMAAAVERYRRQLVVRRGADASLDQVAGLADLLAVAVSSGASIGVAIAVVHRHLPADRSVGLDALVREIAAGSRLDAALVRWGEVQPSPCDELAALLRSADLGGVAVLDGLGRLAVDLRRRRRRAAEERARRLPVTMLMPLVLCILPAFGLVTVVPMIAVGVDRLAGL